MLVKVKDRQVVEAGLPKIGTLSDGRLVTNYDLLPPDALTAEGWLPLEHDMPAYDTATQEAVFDRYDIQADKVIVRYTVQEKPAPQPVMPTEQEVLRDYVLDLDYRLIMMELGL